MSDDEKWYLRWVVTLATIIVVVLCASAFRQYASCVTYDVATHKFSGRADSRTPCTNNSKYRFPCEAECGPGAYPCDFAAEEGCTADGVARVVLTLNVVGDVARRVFSKEILEPLLYIGIGVLIFILLRSVLKSIFGPGAPRSPFIERLTSGDIPKLYGLLFALSLVAWLAMEGILVATPLAVTVGILLGSLIGLQTGNRGGASVQARGASGGIYFYQFILIVPLVAASGWLWYTGKIGITELAVVAGAVLGYALGLQACRWEPVAAPDSGEPKKPDSAPAPVKPPPDKPGEAAT